SARGRSRGPAVGSGAGLALSLYLGRGLPRIATALDMGIAVRDAFLDVRHAEQRNDLRLLIVAAAIVPGRRGDAGVAGEALDGAEVSTSPQQASDVAPAKIVRRQMRDAGLGSS